MNNIALLTVLLSIKIIFRKKQLSCEDKYLKEKHISQNKKSWIIMRVEYTLDKKLYSKLQKNLKKLNNWFNSIYNFYLKIKISKNDNIPDNNYDVNIDISNNFYHILFDHSIVGGETITRLVSAVTFTSQLINLPKSDTYLSLLSLPKFIFSKPYNIKSELLHITTNSLRRYVWDIETNVEGSKYLILHKVLRKIYKCIKNDKRQKISVALPIAFINNDSNQFNNIGLIWIQFCPKEIQTPEKLKQYFEKQKYQAIVTNHLLNKKLVPNNRSKSTRNKLDAIISMTYAYNPITNYVTWSYFDQPDYPLYIAIGTAKYTTSNILKTRITLTVNTELFTPSKDFTSFHIENNKIIL